jgi:hypothetical protein
MKSFGFTDADLLITPQALVQKLGKRMDALWKAQPSAKNRIWTSEVKTYLADIAQEIAEERAPLALQTIYTKSAPGVSEFLLDLVWWCKRGEDFREEFMALAVEVEWASWWSLKSMTAAIGADFGKLTVVKCPLKLMVFCTDKDKKTGTHERWQKNILNEIERYLNSYSHHIPGEHYILLDTASDGNRCAWIRSVDQNGILSALAPLATG